MLNGAMFLIILFFMPETIFDRPDNSTEESFSDDDDKEKIVEIENVLTQGEPYRSPPMQFRTYMRRMWFWYLDRPASRQMKAKDFVIKPLSLLKYPSIAFPVLYLCVSILCIHFRYWHLILLESSVTYGFASIEPALTLATLFTKIYKFDTAQNG